MHTVARPGTTVIYSDHDPVVVEYAHEILANTPNVYYFQADARRPDELLSRPEVKEILGDGRDVALVFWGIGIFLTDDDVSQAAQTLHRWAGPKACLAFNAQAADVSADDPRVAEVAKMYQQMGSAIFFRSLDRYQQLVKPWRTDEQGFVSLLDWHGVSTSEMGKEDRQSFGPSGGAFGGYLVK
jgi:hypothetical protein